ncbi:hypothetical protein SISNIDRAFT_449062 [Sistotremastrum niveocremeum HHB9708]|uniref:Uncharacterized protein n=1 Tax=Sistotremastrum niveocremeum HHB9708 TaxID=1314777 RepID=A0A164Z4L4_9AGAM|nr:hypothetical protein SISNIDRAFT_449062 [Sistotremastrum niveocremeum HHB9708]
MKSLRRSLNKDAHHGLPQISTPLSSMPLVSKPSHAVQPPKKVIRALQTYRPNAPQELSFSKGDFFYVIRDVDTGIGWYEAHNPVTGARGLVPKGLFEEFNKANAAMRASASAQNTRNSASISPSSPDSSPGSGRSPISPRQQTFFAVVMHDFTAERPDELDAKAGDNISVVAQSNREWFVAKPIGRLGRPGLIPVSFVEVQDPATGKPYTPERILDIMDSGELPRVEDWKKAMLEYKASSIPLGVIDDNAPPTGGSSPYMTSPGSSTQVSAASKIGNSAAPGPMSANGSSYGVDQQNWNHETLPMSVDEPQSSSPGLKLAPGMLASAEVVSFHFENEEYWFRINAIWQPLDPLTKKPTPHANRLVIFRVYDDFYDFQITLLDAFPLEAGRQADQSDPRQSSGSSRILPYMPGPVEQVDDIVTSLRREELDNYVAQLCALVDIGAEHVLKHDLVRDFFTPKPGDVETEVQSPYFDEAEQARIMSGIEGLSLKQQRSSGGHGHGHDTDGSDYGGGEDTERPKQMYSLQSSANPLYDSQPQHSAGSGRSSPRRSWQNHQHKTSMSHQRQPSPLYKPSPIDTSVYSQQASYAEQSPASMSQSFHSGTSNRKRSGSNANNPPISATNPQTAFIKIKIFDRTSDDLIAIRVNPRVTMQQLLTKARERLGSEVNGLNYRNNANNGFIPLLDDVSLSDWLENSDKHVLYAE